MPGREAYLLFTSGSSGDPKGVPITHENAIAYVEYAAERCDVSEISRLSHTFELTFDPSVFDLFAAWSRGATLVAAQRRELLLPVKHVIERNISHWSSVPSVISVAAQLGGLKPGSMPGLRYSQFIGEQLTISQARAWQLAAPSTAIENAYGPTELTVTCAAYRLPSAEAVWPETGNGTVPIGLVYPHLECLILDEEGRPSTDGELCVRGIQRFHGYLNPHDNIGRFLSWQDGCLSIFDGRSELTDDHWYRTGDRVRQEAGELVHLGRLDRQVKVQGYRIEPGEVEAVLRSYGLVQQAAVILVRSKTDLGELRAVITGEEMSTAALKDYLHERLPTFMVPTTIRQVATWPLGANGKTDYAELSRLVSDDPS
jgi:non-ribosomal peptide synthetase component F